MGRALLDENSEPVEDEILEHILGNHCRGTTTQIHFAYARPDMNLIDSIKDYSE